MTLAGDHSTAGTIIGGSLKRAGFHGLVRYACAGRADVSITPAEIRDLHANSIPVAIVLEHEADWMLHTSTIAARVAGSREICRACGLPDGLIYLACDFDVTLGGPTSPGSPGDRNMRSIASSLGIAAGVIGRSNVGFYGSYWAIEWLIAHGWAGIRYWQTLAWSGGHRHPAACLYQHATSTRVAGVQVDIDDILKPDWGQRGHPAPPAAPANPAGRWHFSGYIDMPGGGWHIQSEPGQGVKFGQHPRRWGAAISVSERDGAWTITPRPFTNT